MRDTTKQTNISITGSSRRTGEKGLEKLFKELIARNFLNLIKSRTDTSKKFKELQMEHTEIHTETHHSRMFKTVTKTKFESSKKKVTHHISEKPNNDRR